MNDQCDAHKDKLLTVFLVGRLLLKNFKFILQFVFTVQLYKHMALGKKKPKENSIKPKVMIIKQNESEKKSQETC